jgi:hypothetical protein
MGLVEVLEKVAWTGKADHDIDAANNWRCMQDILGRLSKRTVQRRASGGHFYPRLTKTTEQWTRRDDETIFPVL